MSDDPSSMPAYEESRRHPCPARRGISEHAWQMETVAKASARSAALASGAVASSGRPGEVLQALEQCGLPSCASARVESKARLV